MLHLFFLIRRNNSVYKILRNLVETLDLITCQPARRTVPRARQTHVRNVP